MLLAFGLLYYVLHKKMINFQELKRLFSSDGLGMLFLALATITLQLFICAQRLRLLLAAQNIRISYRNMLRLTYLGAFFDAFLVTSVGGDAVKAVYLARETQHGHRTMTVSTLLLDRLMGLLGLLSLTVFAALWNFRVMWEQSYFFPHDFFLALILVTGAFFAGTALLSSRRLYKWGPMQWLIHKLPFGGTVNKAYGSLQGFRDRLGAVVVAWALSLLVQLAGLIGGYWLALGLGMHPEIIPFCAAWLIANFICSFSPFMGIGFGQFMYDQMFYLVAGLSNVGGTLATALQLASIIIKFPGLFCWLVTRENDKPPSATLDGKNEP